MARASAPADPLAAYNAKRDFAKTAEPAGKAARSEGGNLFIVQKHAATRLHWDFRIEVDGVLKSWAVTRGPSANPDDKRLAVRTEDHPMAYARFEGTIPKGEYGGGTVMLWDQGTWEPIPGKSAADLEAGHLHFILHGERMKGEWILIRLKPRPGEKQGRENWLLRKIDDEHAGGSDDLVGRGLTSVLTGRSMAEIEADKAGSHSLAGKKGKAFAQEMAAAAEHNAKILPGTGRGTAGAAGGGGGGRTSASSKARSVRHPPSTTAARRSPSPSRGGIPKFHAPQLATLVDAVPAGNDWLHEIKFDGYRALIATSGADVRVFTRNGLDWTDKFAPLVEKIAALDLPPALIDGEITAPDAHGNPSFSALQNVLKRGHASQKPGDRLDFHAFDLISLDGKDLTALPLIERKERLEALLADAQPPIHVSSHVIGAGEKLYDAMCKAGQEGIIAKRIDAPYRSARHKSWVKVKCTRRQEFAIVGWTKSSAKARPFASLLLAQKEGKDFVYKGKVGTGFDAALLDDLAQRMKRLERKSAPVEVAREDARGVTWITPELVAEVAFAEFTAEGRVRHGSFLGLRGDKRAKDVTPEKPAPAPSPTPSVAISNPDRVIFPESGQTKGDLAAYYTALAAPMLAHMGNRPISLVRCPQGRAKKCFFQKHDSGGFSKAVRHVPIREKDGGAEDYIYVTDAEGILSCVQMGTIEFHGWASRADAVESPERMIFDLDPDEGLDFEAVRSAAFDLRDHLAELGLTSFAMTTGGKGVHVVVPLTPGHSWDAHKDFAHRFAEALSQVEPDRFVATMSKAKRKGKIFIDWLRNQRGATAVMPYSARARENAPVAAPITWDELKTIDKPSHWSIDDTAELLERAQSKALAGWGFAAQALPGV